MDRANVITNAQKALKLSNEVEDSLKNQGLDQLLAILNQESSQLVESGYKHVIFKQLIKLLQFENEVPFEKVLLILNEHYYNEPNHQDELAETLIYRFSRSTDLKVSQLCLENISTLIDHMGESVAKHSKKLLQIADINEMIALNPVILEILVKIQNLLPKRKSLS